MADSSASEGVMEYISNYRLMPDQLQDYLQRLFPKQRIDVIVSFVYGIVEVRRQCGQACVQCKFVHVQRARMPNERAQSTQGDKYVAQLPRGLTPVSTLFFRPMGFSNRNAGRNQLHWQEASTQEAPQMRCLAGIVLMARYWGTKRERRGHRSSFWDSWGSSSATGDFERIKLPSKY